MSKKSNALKVWEVAKDANGVKALTIIDEFKNGAVSAARDLDKIIVDRTPIALNLWAAYKYCVKDDKTSFMKALQFYNTFDQTILLKWPPKGDPKRAFMDSHVVLNKLTYLTLTVGRDAAGDGVSKARDPKVAKAEAKTHMSAFGKFCKEAKLTVPKVKFLIVSILKYRDKSGKMSAKGQRYMKAAGVAVASEE